MCQLATTVVGIDVGGERRGFHAVALRDGFLLATNKATDPSVIVGWCLDLSACIVAVDAPCAWSLDSSSRQAGRELNIGGEIIQCFKTPTRDRAQRQVTGFYRWVFNGEMLYQQLAAHYLMFDGIRQKGPMVLETFPHAVVCVLAGKVVGAKRKSTHRRETLRKQCYDNRELPNIDFVDAALCALTASAFIKNRCQCFGNKQEGFIVVPISNPINTG